MVYSAQLDRFLRLRNLAEAEQECQVGECKCLSRTLDIMKCFD